MVRRKASAGRRRRRGRGGSAGPSGRVISPPSIPPTFAAPTPLTTWVEFELTASTSMTTFTTDSIANALTKQYGLNSDSSAATQSFSFRMHRFWAWLIPDTNDTAFGELTIQVIDSPTSGAAVIRQIKGYGSRDRAARIGFVYPTAIQQLPVQSSANFSWIRMFKDARSTGDQTVLFRVQVSLYLFGGDVTPSKVTTTDNFFALN